MWFQCNLNFTVPFTLFFNLLYNDPIRIKHIWKFFGEHLIFCGFSTNRICTIKATDALNTVQIFTFYAKKMVNCTDETLTARRVSRCKEMKRTWTLEQPNIDHLYTVPCYGSQLYWGKVVTIPHHCQLWRSFIAYTSTSHIDQCHGFIVYAF